ncbi:POZ/BTB containin G-protein 1 [Striga asiatica]|uniref:POZ/BTB containin G-protein 1 n=1 Tax=Striga asiatica TaxID=4170 RepID=A0A5A7NWR3_STRAF|nr:POZ/BTB containin G-protein 1 [Striga asiatica]
MGWSYLEVSMADLMKLIRNFIDMMILAAGYQSTGRPAHWDSHNIKKSFQWALFIENQGHAPLSCGTLCQAKDLLLKRLIHTLPLRESHLKAITLACVEMDLSIHKSIDSDFLDIYLEKLMRIPSEDKDPRDCNFVGGDFSVSAAQQLGRRQVAASCLSTAEAGLECIWKTIEECMQNELGNTPDSEPARHPTSLIAGEMPLESTVWNCWRSRSLSYMLDKRTVRLISGANLMFSAPDGQWTQMFERLDVTAEADNLSETIELLLLGCAADRWSGAIECFMSASYESLTISRIHQEVFSSPLGNALNLFSKESLTNPKEKGVVDYLELLLGNQSNQLWKLSPVLAAVAIPSWSRLFRSYLHELENQFRGNSLAARLVDRSSLLGAAIAKLMVWNIGNVYLFKFLITCEVAERMWCLYILHAASGRAVVS